MKAELGPDPFIRQVSVKARGVPERAGFMEGRAEGARARAGRADGAFALHRARARFARSEEFGGPTMVAQQRECA